MDIVGECFHNIVSTDLKLKNSDKKKLKKKLPGNEKIIKFIAKKSNCPEKRRRKLLQSGILTFCISKNQNLPEKERDQTYLIISRFFIIVFRHSFNF